LRIADPFGVTPAFTQDVFAYTEFLGVVDDGFDPKNETRLVVHFEPVLFDTMFDSRSTGAPAHEAGQIRDDFALEVAVKFTPKKVHDFLGAKAQGAVAQ
jgi:hypothetical protein